MDISNDIYCFHKYNLNEDLFNKGKLKKYIKKLEKSNVKSNKRKS